MKVLIEELSQTPIRCDQRKRSRCKKLVKSQRDDLLQRIVVSRVQQRKALAHLRKRAIETRCS